MSIYAMADLHLPFGVDKPMDVFGSVWKNYTQKIYDNWVDTVKEADTVVIPGDLSWATYLKDAYRDFDFINKLPGKKIITKGNHDYFFTTMAKMEKFLKENNFDTIKILQNNFFFCEDILITGSRGWDITSFGEDDKKILNREAIRLELSLSEAKKAYPDKDIYVFMHYPPILKDIKNDNAFLQLFCKYNVKKCFYGHLHSKGISTAFNGEYNNTDFKLISADYLNFMPEIIRKEN